MKKYKRTKKLTQIKHKALKIIFCPLRCINTLIYNLYEKYRKNKRYPYKTILNLVQYCIDYHLNNEDYIYVVYTDFIGRNADEFGCYGYHELTNISCGWNGEHKRIKKKIEHIYSNQNEECIKAIKEICGEPMSKDELKTNFTKEKTDGTSYLSYGYYDIQNKEMCKIINKE